MRRRRFGGACSVRCTVAFVPILGASIVLESLAVMRYRGPLWLGDVLAASLACCRTSGFPAIACQGRSRVTKNQESAAVWPSWGRACRRHQGNPHQ
jgi:hypothetical protein